MNLGMLRLFKFCFLFIFAINASASLKDIEFKLVKKGVDDNNTLLIVGGIQGDEPGGFMAASLISTHYKITKGSVWVVPNLNFYSIIKRARAPHGDMNRKFADISKNDPDYAEVQRIKALIKDPKVKVVLNLHDGSGYYRKTYIDKMHSPYRWGQSSIIDQAEVTIPEYGNLEEIAQRVCNHVNKNLIREEDSYLVHNTNTFQGDKQMEKTLTYYVIKQNKAAFGNEASKNLPVHERVYYHLLALEKYMTIMGIEFERKFELKPREVKNAIDKDIYISFYNDSITLPLSQIRNNLNYFPVDKDGKIDFKASTPLMTVLKNKGYYAIHYGNRRLSILRPDYQEIYDENETVSIKVDGVLQDVKIGSVIKVKKDFLVKSKENYRVNVIGFTNKKYKNEVDVKISKHQIQKRFSIDKKGKIYRVEFYKQNKFAGMILVSFEKKKS